MMTLIKNMTVGTKVATPPTAHSKWGFNGTVTAIKLGGKTLKSGPYWIVTVEDRTGDRETFTMDYEASLKETDRDW